MSFKMKSLTVQTVLNSCGKKQCIEQTKENEARIISKKEVFGLDSKGRNIGNIMMSLKSKTFCKVQPILKGDECLIRSKTSEVDRNVNHVLKSNAFK